MSEVITIGEFCERRKTGEKIVFVVQTAPAEMTEDVVELMTKFFLPREPTSVDKLIGDDVATEMMRNLWRKALREGTSLIALLKENGKTTKIIGSNVTGVERKDRPPDQKTNNANYNAIMKSVNYIAEKGNYFEKYGVDSYLTGYGLTVDPEYHGFNIGFRLLEARRPLCRQLGLKVTGTLFTGPASQKLAKRVGFEVLYEEDYKTFEMNGKKIFETLPGKFQMMGLMF